MLENKTIALSILANLAVYRMYIFCRNLNFSDKTPYVEAFYNKFWCCEVKFKEIYERLTNAHEGKTIALRILANLDQ